MKNTIGKDLVRNIVSIIFIIVCIILIINRTRSDVAGGIDIEDLESLGTSLGIISLLPTILAVFLAFVFKNVILSLLAGLLLGGLIYAGILGGSLLDFFTLSCQELVNTVSDYENASILVLCLAIGGMIEVIRRSGGFSDLAGRMTNHIDTPKKANLFTQLLGVLVFFDDYANALIVGPVMQPICDRLKVSREKLAYIVDSTAAPVTGIALISSWVAVEVGVIEQGLANAGSTLSGYGLFIESIPYCFYCIFCLLFILISSLTGREFGPMYRTECEARKGQIDREYTASYEEEETDRNRLRSSRLYCLWSFFSSTLSAVSSSSGKPTLWLKASLPETSLSVSIICPRYSDRPIRSISSLKRRYLVLSSP